MTDDALVFQDHLVNSFADVKSELEKKVHLLATDGDERLARVALELTKQLFDLGKFRICRLHPQICEVVADMTHRCPARGTLTSPCSPVSRVHLSTYRYRDTFIQETFQGRHCLRKSEARRRAATHTIIGIDDRWTRARTGLATA